MSTNDFITFFCTIAGRLTALSRNFARKLINTATKSGNRFNSFADTVDCRHLFLLPLDQRYCCCSYHLLLLLVTYSATGMDKWTGKVAVVTGASSGIGRETARQLVEKGMVVVGLARREDRLKELENELQGKSGKFYFVQVDLCSEESILSAFKWVKSTLKTVDVLVNNAGVWKQSDLLGNTSEWKQMFDTNVIGLNICSREAIKIMQETECEDGHIINVNSIAGHFQFSFMKDIAVYSATKFSVTTITESLRELLCMQNLPIRVTSVSPGLVETEMTQQIGLTELPGVSKLKSVDVVDAILFALSAPHRVNISEIIIRPRNENISFYMKNC